MRTKLRGKIIHLNGADSIEDMLGLMCVCGHTLGEHSYHWGYGTLKLYYTSQCISCGFTEDNKQFICKQFRLSEDL